MSTQNPLDPNRLLSEAELLLREGLKRIANTAEENLSGAQNPLEEALRLTEEQTMATLAAVERAQDAVTISTTLPFPEMVAPWYQFCSARKSMGLTTESSFPSTSETIIKPRSVNIPSIGSDPKRRGRS